MKKMLICRSIVFFVLLVVVLLCQHTSPHHRRHDSPHRKQTACYAIDDESTIVSRAKAFVLLHRAPASSRSVSADFCEPPVLLKRAKDLVLSRQGTKTYTLRLLLSQTHSSVT